jgi:CRISPR/Cas system-associated protein Cas10 (large subunit of type III CRISPR-Cas system)
MICAGCVDITVRDLIARVTAEQERGNRYAIELAMVSHAEHQQQQAIRHYCSLCGTTLDLGEETPCKDVALAHLERCEENPQGAIIRDLQEELDKLRAKVAWECSFCDLELNHAPRPAQSADHLAICPGIRKFFVLRRKYSSEP